MLHDANTRCIDLQTASSWHYFITIKTGDAQTSQNVITICSYKKCKLCSITNTLTSCNNTFIVTGFLPCPKIVLIIIIIMKTCVCATSMLLFLHYILRQNFSFTGHALLRPQIKLDHPPSLTLMWVTFRYTSANISLSLIKTLSNHCNITLPIHNC